MLIRFFQFGLAFAGVCLVLTQIIIPAIRGGVLFPLLRPETRRLARAVREAEVKREEAETRRQVVEKDILADQEDVMAARASFHHSVDDLHPMGSIGQNVDKEKDNS
jgi:hypothetical protein